MSFNVDTYNNLPFVNVADARFNEQLTSAGLTREQLFFKLEPLFQPQYAERYAICLIHRHFPLNDGERMVTTDRSTIDRSTTSRPSTEPSPNIVAERWLSSDQEIQEIEHRFADDPISLPPPPPADFMDKYKSILNSHGINVLGISFADVPRPGYIFLESDGPEDRERITSEIHLSARNKESYDVSWVVTRNIHQNFSDDSDHDAPVTITAGCCNWSSCHTGNSSVPAPPVKTSGREL